MMTRQESVTGSPPTNLSHRSLHHQKNLAKSTRQNRTQSAHQSTQSSAKYRWPAPHHSPKVWAYRSQPSQHVPVACVCKASGNLSQHSFRVSSRKHQACDLHCTGMGGPIKVGPLGLRQGREFEERSSGVLKELHVWYSPAGVHQISTVYSDGATYRHGLETPGCHCSIIYLLPGEALTYVHGSIGRVVFSLAFHTSLQRSYRPFGKALGCPFGFCGPALNLLGRCDHMIRAIGAYCTFR